jgi:hydrogenase maturation protease
VTLVIGVGNEWRGDDGAGLEAARRLSPPPPGSRVIERPGEPLDLIEEWEAEAEVFLVDAVSSGAAPGTIHRVDARERRLPAELFRGSTHALSVAEAVELARVLGRLPGRLRLYGIEGGDFGAGSTLTANVETAVDALVREIRERLRTASAENHRWRPERVRLR